MTIPRPEVRSRPETQLNDLFPWMKSFPDQAGPANLARVTSAWISKHPFKPLFAMSRYVARSTEITGNGTRLDLFIDEWKRQSPDMLAWSARDLLTLEGVGPRRQTMLVELVVAAAVAEQRRHNEELGLPATSQLDEPGRWAPKPKERAPLPAMKQAALEKKPPAEVHQPSEEKPPFAWSLQMIMATMYITFMVFAAPNIAFSFVVAAAGAMLIYKAGLKEGQKMLEGPRSRYFRPINPNEDDHPELIR